MWAMASFNPATTSLPTRPSLSPPRGRFLTAALFLVMFQYLHKLLDRLAIGGGHVRLFALRIDREHIHHRLGGDVVIDRPDAPAFAFLPRPHRAFRTPPVPGTTG